MRSRRRLILILAVAAAAAAIAVVVAGGGSRERQEPDFGADVGDLFQDRYPAGVVGRALAGARAAGLGLARVAPLWELTEPLPPKEGRHLYTWAYDDRIAAQLSAHGLRWVAVLAFAPGWASVAPRVLHAAPRGTADFAAYAAAVAARYRGLIAAFEIWNEENTRVFWRPAPDAAAYARLYEAARRAIHRADPGVPVVIGGLAGARLSFLDRLLAQPELRGAIDGLAIHAYAPTPAGVLAQVRRYRLRLDELDFGAVPLFVTEYGWSSRRIAPTPGGPPVPKGSYAPPSVRATLIVRAARDVLASGCNVRMAIFYAWLTPERDPQAFYDWYGVVAPSGASTGTSEGIAAQSSILASPRASEVMNCAGPG